MGGNLFKLGRLPKAEYKSIEQELCRYLDEKFGDNYRIPRYYDDKPDFGDMDIVISTAAITGNWQQLQQELIADLQLEQYKSTGAVFSTVYRNFQVDYFVRKAKYFESTYSFLSFNDIGNLIGRIFKKFNLKYGEHGLFYVFRRADNHYVKDIPISQDFKKIFTFLGLDYEKWQIGFANKIEMFDWVVASPYFSVTPYTIDGQSKTMSKRVQQRPTIQAFLEYIEVNQLSKSYAFLKRDEYIPRIAEYFPEANLIAQLAEEKQREVYVNAIRAKYNGKVIMQLIPALSGKQLGLFMKDFQAQFKDYEATLYALDVAEIQIQLMSFYASWSQHKA